MRCPKHPEVWLYENMLETEGFYPKCQEWYPLIDVSINLLCRPRNISMEKKEKTDMTKHWCEGKPQHNPHPRTEMVLLKSWTLQGQNQKKPMTIEMYQCPIEHCHKYIRVAVKD